MGEGGGGQELEEEQEQAEEEESEEHPHCPHHLEEVEGAGEKMGGGGKAEELAGHMCPTCSHKSNISLSLFYPGVVKDQGPGSR